MDLDLTKVLDNSFDTLEEAFSDESRKVVRQIKCEWQKIVKYRDDISTKEEELISAKNNLMHLNDIKLENEKYIKATQCRIENLKQNNTQLKSKWCLLKKEEERAAKKYKEDQEYMTKKLAAYEEKWRQRYEKSYSKNPKIKEKVQALRELEETWQKLYIVDDELQKYEKKLFQAKCARNKRAIEESKLYPFSSFIVNIAKIYLQTLKEYEECQRLTKEIYAIESAKSMKSTKNLESTPSRGTLQSLPLQNIEISEVDDKNIQELENNKNESKYYNSLQNSGNVTSSMYGKENLTIEKFQNWNKGEKTKYVSKIHNKHSLLSETDAYRSPIVKKWMEKYKICTPKLKESSDFEIKSISLNNENKENKTNFSKFHIEGKLSAQGNHNSTIDDAKIKSTDCLRKDFISKNSEDSKHTFLPVSEKKMSTASSYRKFSEFDRFFMTKQQQCKDTPTELSIKNEMHLSNSNKLPLQEINESISRKYATNIMQITGENITSFTVPPNVNQKKYNQNIVTPFYSEKGEYVDADSSVNNSKHLRQNNFPVPQEDKDTESAQFNLTNVLSPSKKESIPMQSFTVYAEKKKDSTINKAEVQVGPAAHLLKNASKYFQNSGINAKNDACLVNEDVSVISTTRIVQKEETQVSEHNLKQFNEKLNVSNEKICNIQDDNKDKQKTYDHGISQQTLEYPSPRDVSVNDTELKQNNIEQLKNTNIEEKIMIKKDFHTHIEHNLKQDKQYMSKESIQCVQPQNSNPNYLAKKAEDEEDIGKSSNTEMSYTQGTHDSNTSHSTSKLISDVSEYHTPTSKISTPKSVESNFKPPTNKQSQHSTGENAVLAGNDIPNFSPFKADQMSPGFTYTTRPMYQPSTSNANPDQSLREGPQRNMFELANFFNVENVKEITQTKNMEQEDEEKNDFLVSTYENYLNDSPPTRDGTEKNMFAVGDSPEHSNDPGGLFPLFAGANSSNKNNDTPFNFSFGGTDAVKSPEENSGFKFLF